jgi:hypothetical protein
MKKSLLLLGFLFIGIISFANSTPNGIIAQNQRVTLAKIVSSVTNGIFIEGSNSKTTEVVAKAPKLKRLTNLNEDVEPSCTLTTEISIGYAGSSISVQCSVTAATCKKAMQMLLSCLP